MLHTPKVPFAKLHREKKMPRHFVQYIHKALQTVADSLPRLARVKGGFRKFCHSEWYFRKKLTMRHSTDEIQSITSVVQNAVIMPIVFYIREHLVQSC